jgi:hypothetical protein
LPVLGFDDATLEAVEEMGKMELLLRLAHRQGRGVGFRVEELDSVVVQAFWLGRNTALAMLFISA